MNTTDLRKKFGENCIGRVIRIIDKQRIIIDVGEDEITLGDSIQIYYPADKIKDLDGNSLGIFEEIKATLRVTQTSKQYSVCSDIYEETYSPLTIMQESLTTVRTVTRSLPVNEQDIEPLSVNVDKKYILVGDPVKNLSFGKKFST